MSEGLPIGLAAGFAKDMTTANLLLSLGFSSVELGTFTLKPHAGNPHPRLERIPEGLRNRMGFPNPGIAAFLEDLEWSPPVGRVGVNLSALDAEKIIPLLGESVDYLAINCSSPNTPEVATVPFEQITAIPHRRPLYLKINPEQIEAAIAAEPDGLILCNTDQGVSGPDLLGRTIRAVRHARSLTTLPIIGCGGIWSKEAAGCVLEAGASEVQVLTSWLLGGFRPMTEQKDEWTDTSQKPEDEFQYLKLRCSDGKDRYGYGTRWPDNTWAGWIIDETGDFIDGVLADYEVTGWMPADIPEPAMEMPA